MTGHATAARHAYLSTACFHGVHVHCRSVTAADGGRKKPGTCKFCDAVCLCPVCRHPGAPVGLAGRARAFYRGYPALADRRSKRVTRLHVMREDGRWGGQQGWCGTSARTHVESEPVILDPMPAAPPAGLSWCPPCIGHLAALAGCIDGVAVLLSQTAVAR